MELNQPQANSTLLELADEPVDSTSVEETETEAGEINSLKLISNHHEMLIHLLQSGGKAVLVRELEVHQANSTHLEPDDEPVDPTQVGETETESGEEGNIDQFSEFQHQANLTLIQPANEPVDSTTIGETRTEADKEGSKLGLQQVISSSLL